MAVVTEYHKREGMCGLSNLCVHYGNIGFSMISMPI